MDNHQICNDETINKQFSEELRIIDECIETLEAINSKFSIASYLRDKN